MRGIAELAPRSREQARKDDTKSRTKHHQFGGMIFQTIRGCGELFDAYARQPLALIGKGAQASERLYQGDTSGRGAARSHRKGVTDDAISFSKSRVAQS